MCCLLTMTYPSLGSFSALYDSERLLTGLTPAADWWKQLPVIFMPCVTEAEGGDASFVQADISPDPALEDPHVFGFASKEDATCFSWLLQQSDQESTCRYATTVHIRVHAAPYWSWCVMWIQACMRFSTLLACA